MVSKIPLPTDNIYKFYALFGLVIVIFCAGMLVYVNQTTNNQIFGSVAEQQVLLNIPESVRTTQEEVKIAVLERKLEIAKSNRTFYLAVITLLITIGIYMIWYGFKTWHTVIQPMQDEITRLNIKKIKQEVGENEIT